MISIAWFTVPWLAIFSCVIHEPSYNVGKSRTGLNQFVYYFTHRLVGLFFLGGGRVEWWPQKFACCCCFLFRIEIFSISNWSQCGKASRIHLTQWLPSMQWVSDNFQRGSYLSMHAHICSNWAILWHCTALHYVVSLDFGRVNFSITFLNHIMSCSCRTII